MYTSLFGRDPANVTMTGESAGVGSVMLHSLAYEGSRGLSLFRNVSDPRVDHHLLSGTEKETVNCCIAVSFLPVQI